MNGVKMMCESSIDVLKSDSIEDILRNIEEEMHF